MENKILASVNGNNITQNDVNIAMGRFPKENQEFLHLNKVKYNF